MSRYTQMIKTTLFGNEVDEIAFGHDHVFGYFIQGFLDDELIIDRNSLPGMSMTGHDEALGNSEFADTLIELKELNKASLVFLDLPI